MIQRTSQLAEKIRDRLGERALAGAPQWLEPALPAARASSLGLLIGSLLGKLPAEDASALVQTVLSEQRTDGSWARTSGGGGDLSLTLEAVEALSQAGDAQSQTALAKAVGWLETHRHGARLDEETLILLGAVADIVPGRLRRLLLPLARMVMRHRAGTSARRHRSEVLPLALAILSCDKNGAFGRGQRLLELQLLDGSWEGSTQSTVFALAALRHASLPADDAVFERGWRFLRSLQLWSGERLVQNPCDLSNVLHAAAVRALLVAGADSDVAASSTLSLLHQARTHGGWAAGGMLPTDLLTTALALDALSFAGDVPVETSWSRRRAVLLLLHTQHGCGGWPLYPDARNTIFTRFGHPHGRRTNPSSLDVTAACVQALAYSGVRVPGEDAALARGVHFLLTRQLECGLWPADTVQSALFTTARALEALVGAADDRAGRAVVRAITALLAQQGADGGWSDDGTTSTPHHTAWVVRALCGVPGVPLDVLRRARQFLEESLDASELLWQSPGVVWPLPVGEACIRLADLTTLWALEALVPAGIAVRSRVTGAARSGSIFHRSR